MGNIFSQEHDTIFSLDDILTTSIFELENNIIDINNTLTTIQYKIKSLPKKNGNCCKCNCHYNSSDLYTPYTMNYSKEENLINPWEYYEFNKYHKKDSIILKNNKCTNTHTNNHKLKQD